MILDQTAFYAESGGQVGDRGLLTTVSDGGDNGASGSLASAALVHDVQRAAGGSLFVHSVAVQQGRMHVGQQARSSTSGAQTVGSRLRRLAQVRTSPCDELASSTHKAACTSQPESRTGPGAIRAAHVPRKMQPSANITLATLQKPWRLCSGDSNV